MAFTTRSKRLESKIERPHLGPGRYNLAVDRGPPPSIAPFTSKADRGLTNPVVSATISPGPGAYRADSQHASASGANLLLQAQRSSVFATTVPRFAQDTSTAKDTPGPGAYPQASAWGRNRPRPRGSVSGEEPPPPPSRAIFFHRAASAPSVPTKSQSYGYEDTPTGELVMQRPRQEGYTGIGRDVPGPGSYDVAPHVIHTATRVTDFARSRAVRRVFEPKKGTPGPGAYTPFEAVSEPTTSRGADTANGRAASPVPLAPGYLESRRRPSRGLQSRPSHIFASQSLRAHQVYPKPEEVTPGPGEYVGMAGRGNGASPLHTRGHDDEEWRAQEQKEAAVKPFGSSQPRSYEIAPHVLRSAPTWMKTPGPGAYYDERRHTWGPTQATTIHPNAPAKQQTSGPPPAAPFSSTSTRFEDSSTLAPGPGAYDVDPVPSAALQHRRSSPLSDPTTSALPAATLAPGFLSSSERFSSKGGANLGLSSSEAVSYKGPQNNSKIFLQRSPSGRIGDLASDNSDRKPLAPTNTPQGPRMHRSAPRRSVAPSAPFTSGYDRFARLPVTKEGAQLVGEISNPAPGQYDVKRLWSETEREAGGMGAERSRATQSAAVSTSAGIPRDAGFTTKAKRFPSPRIPDTPGPGRYNPKVQATWATSAPKYDPGKPPHNLNFLSTVPRFFGPANEVPGPGAYNHAQARGSLVKRSFNVTLDGMDF